MKYIFLLTTALILFVSCNQKSKNTSENTTNEQIEVVAQAPYPEALQKVFEAHGGLKQWKKQRTLTYTIPKPDNPETHITDLYHRFDKIETPKYDMGFDGNQPWLLNKTSEYEGNVEFYHNLMFYFYAMPFVLADNGIQYHETAPIEFEGKSYPGIGISYNSGVGTSPKDEYFIHYDPETYQMEWLGYTVTYRTKEKSENVKWIRYNDWATFNGVKLPNAISWYNYEGTTIKDLRNTVPFEGVVLSTDSKPEAFYEKPEVAAYYNKSSE